MVKYDLRGKSMFKSIIVLCFLSINGFSQTKVVDKGWTKFQFIDDQGTKTTGEVKNFKRVGNIKNFKKLRADSKIEKYINVSVPVVSKALPSIKDINHKSKFKINPQYKNEVRNIRTTQSSRRNGVTFKVGKDIELNASTNSNDKINERSTFGSPTNKREPAQKRDSTKSTLPKASKSGWDPYASLRGFYD